MPPGRRGGLPGGESMAILDTNVLIDFINGDEDVRSRIGDMASGGLAATTIITEYELLKGTRKTEEDEAVAKVLGSINVYQLDYETVRATSSIFKELKKIGKPIPEPDILIAGVAIARGETLVSRDEHFRKVPGLELLLI